MSVTADDLRALEEFERRGYHNGGFKIYDVSNPAQPKLICYRKTGGRGVHRFDVDERHAYISTEMEGFIGNILVIYDLRDPQAPEKSRAGGCPGSMSPAARRRPGRDGGIGCIMRCVSATRCGRAAGTAASGWSTSPTFAKPRSARQLQLPSAVSGADAYRDAGAGPHRRPPHRARHRRGGPGPERERGGGAARARACLHLDAST